jgi:hypothetical protein
MYKTGDFAKGNDGIYFSGRKRRSGKINAFRIGWEKLKRPVDKT